MSSKHLIDPELLPLLAQFPQEELTRETLPLIRANMEQAVHLALQAVPQGVASSQELRVPGPKGAPEVRLVVYRPVGEAANLPVYLHMHGGGYVLGKPELGAVRNSALAAELRCLVVSVDYRLGPECPHPAPVEDCYAALRWIHANASRLGGDPRRIAIGGESAGAGLAAALGLLARDRADVPLIFQLLIYPMLDDRTCVVRDPHPYTGEFIWTASSNRFGWTALLGHEPGRPGVSPYAAAARADNLAGLPPTRIATGALDLFLEENLEYARRLTRAAVPTELHVYPGAFHGFDMLPTATVSRDFERDYRVALSRAFQRTA